MKLFRRLLSAPRFAHVLWGVLASLGLPGPNWTLLLFLGSLLHLSGCTQSLHLRDHWLRSFGFLIGSATPLALGGWSWGLQVVALLFANSLIYWVPLSLCVYFLSCNNVGGPRSFFLTTGWMAMVLELARALGGPGSAYLTSLVETAPLATLAVRVIGVSLAEALIAACLVSLALFVAEGPSAARRSHAVALVGGGSAYVALSLLGRLQAPAPRQTVQVGVPQINVGPDYFQSRVVNPHAARLFRERVKGLVSALSGVDLLVYPESHDGSFSWMLPSTRAELQQRAKIARQAIVYTSFLLEPDGKKSNAAVLISNQGQPSRPYKKQFLAPVGERVIARGKQISVPKEVIPGVHLSAAICNESLHEAPLRASVLAGANLIAVPTSDITFASSPVTFFHLALTRLNAVALGRDVIWASNGGPSGVITRFGEMPLVSPLRTGAALTGTARTYNDRTPYLVARWFWSAAPLLLFALTLFSGRATARSHDISPKPRLLRQDIVGWALAGMICSCNALVAPALIEASHGQARRAWLAVWDTFRPAVTRRSELFRDVFASPDPSASARQVIRFILVYLGAPHATRVAEMRPSSLEELAGILRERSYFSTTSFDWVERGVPDEPLIVFSEAGGFAVLQKGKGPRGVQLFTPSAGVRDVTIAQAQKRFGPIGILPTSPNHPTRHDAISQEDRLRKGWR